MEDISRASDLLAAALQDHDIKFRKEIIATELDNGSQQGRSNAQWVIEHISPSTLLSKDEAALVKSLERSGVLETLLRQPDLTSTRALTEDEIREATATLKASTATCAKQVAAFKSQLELTERIQSGKRTADRNQDRYMNGLNKKHLLEKRRIKAMAEDIKNDFESRMHEYQQQKQAERKHLLQSISSKLVADDEILSKAERIMEDSELTEADGQLEKRTLDLLSILSALDAEEIRCRLDRLYLEGSLSNGEVLADASEDTDAKIALEEDLESLYSEIEVLAEVSARQEFGQPIFGELRRNKQHSAHSLEENLDLILKVLAQMTSSTAQETNNILYRHSHREALDHLSVMFMEEVTSREAEQIQIKKAHRRQSSLSSPVKAPQPRNSNATPSLQALESFLRRLGISPSASLTANELAFEKRTELVDILHHNLSLGAEMPLYESLSSSDQAKELLTSILHADSHAEPSLVDVTQKEHLSDLERELAALQKDIENVNLNVLVEPDRSRDTFIEKWGQS